METDSNAGAGEFTFEITSAVGHALLESASELNISEQSASELNISEQSAPEQSAPELITSELNISELNSSLITGTNHIIPAANDIISSLYNLDTVPTQLEIRILILFQLIMRNLIESQNNSNIIPVHTDIIYNIITYHEP